MATPGRQGSALWTLTATLLTMLGFVFGSWTSCAAQQPEPREARAATREHTQGKQAKSPPPLAIASSMGDDVQMSARVDRTAVLHGSAGELYVELRLEAKASPGAEPRAATDVVVILDRSGSMEGEKLAYAKRAIEHLLSRLTSEDRFALVAYESSAHVVLPLWPATEQNKTRAFRKVAALDTAGGTNMSSGMDLALDVLPAGPRERRMQRVLLLSDGLANEGDASREGLMRRARAFTQRGAVLTSMGIGDDFDESLMAALSDAGEGNFYYLARLDALPGFFSAEFDAAARTVASSLAVHFVPGAFVKLLDASGYPLERNAGEITFRPGALYAGQKRSIWLSMQVPTERLERFSLGSLRLDYVAGDQRHELHAAIAPEVECVADNERFENGIVKEVWEAAVSRDAASKTQRVLADAVANGNAADVDRAASEYVSKNQALAAKLKSNVVQQSIDDVQKHAEAAKQAQNASAPARHVASKRMKASSSFLERKDAYSRDPMLGM